MEISQQLSEIKSSYIREILAATQAPEMLSLAGGLPASELLPVSQLMRAMESLIDTPEVFQYGETIGYKPLLDFLRDKYLHPAEIETMVCTGSQQAIDLIARAYLNSGDIVAMEAPSYLGALQVFGLAQANIKSLEQTRGGPDLNQLEALFSAGSVKFFYCVPDFHNPSGVCWSIETRKVVAQLCTKYGVMLIEDVPYRDLRFSGAELPLVSSFCAEYSFVIRSFSKVVAPGLRLGVVSAPKELLSPLVQIKQVADLHTAVPMQAALLALLKSDEFASHVTLIKSIYHKRYNRLYNALTPLFDEHCQCDPVEGGMFVWLRLLRIDARELTRRLLTKNVAVVPGDVFYRNQQDACEAVRINFSHSSCNKLDIAVEQIKQALSN